MSIIYKLTNLHNQKHYIGKTTRSVEIRLHDQHKDIRRRLKAGRQLTPIQKAFQKYGFDAFAVEILFSGEVPLDELNALEVAYIARFESNDRIHGYNCSSGGDGGFIPAAHTPEARAKRSLAMKGNSRCRGRRLTEQHKANIALRTREAMNTAEWRAAQSARITAWWKTRKASEVSPLQ